MGVSVLIITKNEEKNIRSCLESVKWAEEIVIIDSFSQDNTIAICKEYTENIFQRVWDDYSSQKNFGNSKCFQDWILSIDADESVSQLLKNEILCAIKSPKFNGYKISIRDFMFGDWIYHGGWDKQLHVRLYRRHKASWQNEIHETILVEGNVGELQNVIFHKSHTSIEKFVEKMNEYTTLEAKSLFDQGVQYNWFKVVRMIPWHFFQRYILWQGYKDGARGFILAVLIGVYHFLTRIKLWEIWQKNNQSTNNQ